MFYETSFLLLAILVTAVITRHLTANEFKQGMFGLNRFNDKALKRKLYVSKLAIIFLFFMVLALWARLPVDA
jgi:hypothetical protein